MTSSNSLKAFLWLALVVVAFAVPSFLYPSMPEQVPSHWSIEGVADGFTPKPWGPFISTCAVLAIALVYVAIPRLSPKGFQIESFRSSYDAMMLTLAAAMCVVSVSVAFASAGYDMPVGRIVGVSVGLAIAVLGNLMGKVRKNFFVGIRTPWTLADDEVWLRTHRVAGVLFTCAGLLMACTAFTHVFVMVGIFAVLAAAIVPVLYSYVCYRQLA